MWQMGGWEGGGGGGWGGVVEWWRVGGGGGGGEWVREGEGEAHILFSECSNHRYYKFKSSFEICVSSIEGLVWYICVCH